jgi:hypothetical protein
MKNSLSKIVANRYGGRNLPIALVLPDGGRVALSASPEVDVYARTWDGLRAFASPNLGRLARAYVHGDIDFSGGARRVLALSDALVGSVTHGRERQREVPAVVASTSRNKPNVSITMMSLTPFTALARRAHGVLVRLFQTDTDTLDQAQARKPITFAAS